MDTQKCVKPIRATMETPSYLIFQPPQNEESSSEGPWLLQERYVRIMRVYGIDFKEGPDEIGVNAAKDVEPLRRSWGHDFSARAM